MRSVIDTEERLRSGGGVLVSRNLCVQCVVAVFIPNCKWVTLRFPSSMMNLASSVPHCASPASYRSYNEITHKHFFKTQVKRSKTHLLGCMVGHTQ